MKILKTFHDIYNWIVRYVHELKDNSLLKIAQQLVDYIEKRLHSSYTKGRF